MHEKHGPEFFVCISPTTDTIYRPVRHSYETGRVYDKRPKRYKRTVCVRTEELANATMEEVTRSTTIDVFHNR
jgi:hypothetical protein